MEDAVDSCGCGGNSCDAGVSGVISFIFVVVWVVILESVGFDCVCWLVGFCDR